MGTLLLASACSNSAATESLSTESADTADISSCYEVTSDSIEISEVSTYTVSLYNSDEETSLWNVAEGDDVTGWFVQEDGTPAFTDETGVATITSVNNDEIIISLDSNQISNFNFSGSSTLYIYPTEAAFTSVKQGPGVSLDVAILPVGEVVIPTLTVEREVYGSGFSDGASTMIYESGEGVDYTESATLSLELDDLDPALIEERVTYLVTLSSMKSTA